MQEALRGPDSLYGGPLDLVDEVNAFIGAKMLRRNLSTERRTSSP